MSPLSVASKIADAGATVLYRYLQFRSTFGHSLRSSDHEKLLQAALLHGDMARQAWQNLKPHLDIDRLMPETVRLLPLLYGNLTAIQIDDPVMPRLRGFYRRTWYANQMILHSLQAVLHRLHTAGIETLTMRGIAIGLRYYGDLGLRPMNAFDLLVRSTSVPEATRVLNELGWSPFTIWEPVSNRRSTRFQHPRAGRCRLHWSVSGAGPHTGDEDMIPLWSRSQDFTSGNISFRTLSPEDEFVSVCIRGTGVGWRPRLQWVADAAKIFGTSESAIHSSVFTEGSRGTIRMRAAARFLDAAVKLSIPSESSTKEGVTKTTSQPRFPTPPHSAA